MNAGFPTHLLIEFRKRFIRSLVVLGGVLLVSVYFANDLYTLLALPLLKQLPFSPHLIAIDIASAFLTPFEFAFYLAIFCTMPFFLFQVWRFISPALYIHEKRMIWPFLIISIVLFYAGNLFAYLLIFPVIFSFFVHVVPKGVQLMPDINQYLSFTLRLLLIFGLMFEVPIIIVILAKLKIVSYEKFKQCRPYMIIAAFVVGMLIAPDILSQCLIAIPLWGLYETGVFLTKIVL